MPKLSATEAAAVARLRALAKDLSLGILGTASATDGTREVGLMGRTVAMPPTSDGPRAVTEGRPVPPA